MNIMYLKYAVEIAATGSLNKAADRLEIGQPNLSRALRELEASLGVTLFTRSTKGMQVTPEGALLLQHAQTILRQVDAVENLFKHGVAKKTHFSISVPRASYISEAFATFSQRLNDLDAAEVFYKETNSMRAIKNILQENYSLAIVRYAENFDRYYQDEFASKDLVGELVTSFRYVLLMSEQCPLNKRKEITFSALQNHIEIAHGDPYVPSLSLTAVKKEELPEMDRRIFVYERGSQFDLLSANPDTFMWVSPVPVKVLQRYGLVQRDCPENQKIYRDVLIHRQNYCLTKLDKAFIEELSNIKRQNFSS